MDSTDDTGKTKEQLLAELAILRQRVAEGTTTLQATNAQWRAEVRKHMRSEQATQQARLYAEGIVNTMREPLIVLDADLRVLSANRAFYQRFQVTPEESEHHLLYELGNGQWDAPKLRFLLEEILPTHMTIDDFEVTQAFPHIGQRTMLLNARQIAWEDEKSRRILLAIEDITERKQTEEDWRHLEEQLRQSQKMEAIGILAGGIAHEFNNILAAMLGFTEMATFDLPPTHPVSQYLHEVLTTGRRAKDLVQQILAFSRQSECERLPVSCAQLVQEVLPLLRASFPSTIAIYPHITAEASTVLADPTQIHQILLNLCVNADYAMRETGGVLEIGVDRVEVDDAFPAFPLNLHAGSYVCLTFRDTGSGMAPDVLERIFEPFFTTKGIGEGTGMGLAIVHGIVTSHGGAITVESTLRAGTTFAIYLPCLVAPLAGEVRIEEPLQYGIGRILFVDDEDAGARMGQGMLERLGYDVVSSTSSLEALQAFRADPHRFDLVVTDQTMPQMTGEQLASALRRIRPDIPIILCTGFSHLINAEQAEALGIDAYVMKPLDWQKLAHTLQHILSHQDNEKYGFTPFGA